MSAVNYSRDRTVRSMFDRIAGRYDLLNRVISFCLDSWWRRAAIRAVLTGAEPCVLDIGTGTGDLALNAAKHVKGKGRFIGLDFSLPMLNLAQAKRAGTDYGASTATLYTIYFYCLMPRIGGFLSRDPKAYQYLSDSVRQFQPPEKIAQLLREAGFEQVGLRKFLSGAVCMHVANKPRLFAP